MIFLARNIWVAWVSVLCLPTALATPVSVNLTTKPGSSAGNTVLVFDPLNATPAPGRDTASIDQIDKRFEPRISVMRTGTVVSFPNSDNIRHQVYSFSQPKVFSLKLYAGSPSTPIIFDKPGLVVLGCNIHDRMVAFVAVVDSPYFARADAAGTAVFNLPSGRYRLRVWHPGLTSAVATQEVSVDKTPVYLSLAVDIDPEPSTMAAWPD